MFAMIVWTTPMLIQSDHPRTRRSPAGAPPPGAF